MRTQTNLYKLGDGSSMSKSEERLTNAFRDLTEKQEMQICSDIMNYLFYANKNKVKFEEFFIEKYEKKSFEECLADYYFQEVTKRPEIEGWLKRVSVVSDAKEFLKYFNKKINIFFALNPFEIEQIEKVKVLTENYKFIPDVKAIKNFLKKYGRLENIPEEHNCRIIAKIEYLIYHI